MKKEEKNVLMFVVIYYAVLYVIEKSYDFPLIYDLLVEKKEINKVIAEIDYYEMNFHRFKRRVRKEIKLISKNLEFLLKLYHNLENL